MSSTTVHPSRRTRMQTRLEALHARAGADALSWAVLGLAMLVTAALLLYLTRGTTFWFDEWLWITGRRGGGLATYLNPHNSHLSLVPIAIYKLLFATVGIAHYVPYRIVLTAGHLLVVLLLFVYARRRVGPFLALLAAALMLLLGPGWQDILWPFQIAWLLAIASGIGALLVLDRRDRLGDLSACALILVSVASTSVGVAVALGIAVEVLVARRRLRDAWIPAVPIGLYILWTIAYQHAAVEGDVSSAVGFAAQSSAIALPALLGLTGTNALNTAGTILAFGVPLTVAAVAVVIWLSPGRRIWSPRAVTLLAILLAFWALTGIARADLQGPFATRYVYVDAVFFLLLLAELARGVIIGWRLQAALAVITAIAVVSNLGVLRSGASYLRTSADAAEAEMAALNLSRPFATPQYIARSFPGYPFLQLRADDLYAAERELGTVGDDPPQLARAAEPVRRIADTELLAIRNLKLLPQAARPPVSGVAPSVESSVAATVARAGGCVSFAPIAASAGQLNQLAVTIPAGGLWLKASGAQASVGIRRFATAFTAFGSLPAGAGAIVRIPADAAGAPWHLQVTSSGRAELCGLAG